MSTGPTGDSVNPWAVADPAGHRQYPTQIMDSLRNDYHLHAAEAEFAFGQYLGRLTGWLTADHAAFQAHSWWTSTVAPSTALAGDDQRRVHPEHAAQALTHTVDPGTAQSATADGQADHVDRRWIDTPFAAVAAAISMIQEQSPPDGFTIEHRELARQLRQVLDASPLWDTIIPADPAPTDHPQAVDLDSALRPDTVRPRVGTDDEVAIDAAFAGTTITVVRTPGPLGPARYTFLCDSRMGQGEPEYIDPATIGLIATGARTPDPARETEYLCMGLQVRTHLMGLVDALADSRDGWHEQQARRLNMASGAPDTGNDTWRHRNPATPRPAP